MSHTLNMKAVKMSPILWKNKLRYRGYMAGLRCYIVKVKIKMLFN